MSARDDYPLVASLRTAPSAETFRRNPEASVGETQAQCQAALDEIDRLRAELLDAQQRHVDTIERGKARMSKIHEHYIEPETL